MVVSFFSDIAEKKLITVTIREAPYNTLRNTNCQEWQSFLKTLDSSKYKIAIILDANNLSNGVFEGVEYCRVASVNVLFRTAIYRKACLNMFTIMDLLMQQLLAILLCLPPKKYMSMMRPQRIGCVILVQFSDEHHQHAMWKKNQRLVWNPDTTDVLVEAFNTYEKDFPDKPYL